MATMVSITAHERRRCVRHACVTASHRTRCPPGDALACMQIGAATPAGAAAAAVLAEAMRAPAYSRLRTEQQLGYDVDVTPCRHGGGCGVAVSVAGGAATAARARAALPAFLDAFGRDLAAMPKSEFNDLRGSAAMEMVRMLRAVPAVLCTGAAWSSTACSCR